MIKAVIFDMDGVLIDAREWHYDSLNQALELFGYKINRYDHLVTYDGLPTKEKLRRLTIEQGLPRSLHQFISEMKQKYTMEIVHTQCKPTFLHEFALSNLKKDGYRMAVCSNAIKNSVHTMLDKASLLQYLEFYLSNEDVTQAKPNPEIYTTAMQKMALNPSECLIVEDNENGKKAAIASGAHLMPVRDVYDVTYDAIKQAINNIEKA